METEKSPSLLARHEFLIRRLHSLSGLVPVGAYMVVHLIVNASVLNSSATFQRNVYKIHSLGALLPLVEWAFIFIPIIFHAVFGIVIIRGGLSNSSQYPYVSNRRYALQRVTGMIAFVFIFWHVFHMHGWFHSEWWMDNVARNLHGAQFKPYNATSTASAAMGQSIIVIALYSFGVIACVYHLANGIWTMGITWGVWVSPSAQRWANAFCLGFGILIGTVGLSSVWGMVRVDEAQARDVEDKMYKARVESFEIEPNEHKRASHHGTTGNHLNEADVNGVVQADE